MRCAIFTRGLSPRSDYDWSSSPQDKLNVYLGGNGIVTSRNESGTFTVYFESEGSSVTKDFIQREIRIGLFINDITEAKAKGLVAWGLEHWGTFVNEFVPFCNDFGQDSWTINNEAIEQFVDNTIEIPLTGVQFTYRYKNANTPANRNILLENMREFDFFPTSGLKLIVDASAISGTEKMQTVCSQVERYLAKDASFEEWIIPKPKRSLVEFVKKVWSHRKSWCNNTTLKRIVEKHTVEITELQNQITEITMEWDRIRKELETKILSQQEQIEALKTQNNTPSST